MKYWEKNNCVILVLALFVNLFVSSAVTVKAEQSESTEFHLVQTFTGPDGELEQYSNHDKKWSSSKQNINDPNYYVRVEDEKVVFSQVYKHGTMNDDAMNINYSFPNTIQKPTGIVALEASVYLEDHSQYPVQFFDAGGMLKTGGDAVKGVIASIPKGGRTLQVWNGSSIVGCSKELIDDHWNRIKYVINTDTDQFNIYINGEKANSEPLTLYKNFTFDVIHYLEFSTRGVADNPVVGKYYVDNILIYNLDKVVPLALQGIKVDGNSIETGASDVSLNPTIDFDFNNDMDDYTINSDNITVTDSHGASVPYVISHSAGAAVGGNYRRATVSFPQQLEYDTDYTITLGSGVKDLVGQSLNSSVQVNFTTRQDIKINTYTFKDEQNATTLSELPSSGKVNFSINIRNHTFEQQDITIIMAVFDKDDKFKYAESIVDTIGPRNPNYPSDYFARTSKRMISIPEGIEKPYMKVFVYNSLELNRPIGEPVILPAAQ